VNRGKDNDQKYESLHLSSFSRSNLFKHRSENKFKVGVSLDSLILAHTVVCPFQMFGINNHATQCSNPKDLNPQGVTCKKCCDLMDNNPASR
jgi:hypothetical protein